MAIITTEKVQIEPDPIKNRWRIVTRSPHSGRCLKIWAKGPLKEMELLAQGINMQKENCHLLTAKR